MVDAQAAPNYFPYDLTTDQVIDLIFRDPTVKHGLSEFADLGKKPHEILSIYPKKLTTGEVRYYLKCLKREIDIQVYSEKKSNPEEIIRQLWLYKLMHVYKYPSEHIAVESAVDFGTEIAKKPADIEIFQKDGKTAKIIIETKKPERKDGINQLKSYLNAKGSPVGVWSNGQQRIILYRPYPSQFEDTLTEIPAYDQEPKDVLAERLTLSQLKREFDFKRIIEDLEELVLANSGVDEFNEIFKIIFAKLFDEKAARERANNELQFRKSDDPEVTYRTINELFQNSMEEWQGIFDEGEIIKLTPQHLQVVIGPLERIRLLGADMRVMDDAFEYLIPNVAKKKNGQFFTPRYVIDMCIKMLNPQKKEYVLDPACGSAGFLIHVMEYVWPAPDDAKKEERKHGYAGKYLWGIDFDERSAKVARAMMLIAGDGRSHVFRIDSLDPREWFMGQEGEGIRTALRDNNLTARKPPVNRTVSESEAWNFYRDLKFDIILTNPPFSGEKRDEDLLKKYTLAERALTRKSKTGPVEERDVLFIERCLQFLKPGGRAAIILPQSKFNNSSLAYIREWILRRARLLAVVGLHPNTFKPHTGTKTSVIFLQKYTEEQAEQVKRIEESIAEQCPDYKARLQTFINDSSDDREPDEKDLPNEVVEILHELFDVPDEEDITNEFVPELSSDLETEDSDIDALEAEVITHELTLDTLNNQLAAARIAKDKPQQRTLRTQIKGINKLLKEVNETLKRKTLRGRVELLIENTTAITQLRDKWISNELAKRLNYSVFMAVSDKGGKHSSGEYEYRKDVDRNLVEDHHGNPMVLQDCVRYRDEDPEAIAELFVIWAKRQGFSFWSEEQ